VTLSQQFGTLGSIAGIAPGWVTMAATHRSDPARRRIERKIRVATHDQNKTT
jgi:hypothetical protein